MIGQYTHSVDAKGRLFVPTKLREELGDSFYLMIAPDNNLYVFPEAKWQQINERFNAASLSDARAKRYILANVAKVEPDKQGRFVVPPVLRAWANLSGDVTFLGQGDHAEIWDTATYKGGESDFLSSREQLLATMKELSL